MVCYMCGSMNYCVFTTLPCTACERQNPKRDRLTLTPNSVVERVEILAVCIAWNGLYLGLTAQESWFMQAKS